MVKDFAAKRCNNYPVIHQRTRTKLEGVVSSSGAWRYNLRKGPLVRQKLQDAAKFIGCDADVQRHAEERLLLTRQVDRYSSRVN